MSAERRADTHGAERFQVDANAQTHFSWLRTRLSAERTLMSYNRTAIALIGFGFTIYQFLAKLNISKTGRGPRAGERPPIARPVSHRDRPHLPCDRRDRLPRLHQVYLNLDHFQPVGLETSRHPYGDAARRRAAVRRGGVRVRGRPAAHLMADVMRPAQASAVSHFSWLRSKMSADRTLMAYARSSISFIGVGFAIYEYLAAHGDAKAVVVGRGMSAPAVARPRAHGRRRHPVDRGDHGLPAVPRLVEGPGLR